VNKNSFVALQQRNAARTSRQITQVSEQIFDLINLMNCIMNF